MASDSVLIVQRPAPEVAVLIMQDVAHKNMFSAALAESLVGAFSELERDPACHVLVLTGHGNYFAMGGTPEGLLAIHEGRAKCTDGGFYRLPLDCKLPVISAMQGHGIGGGLAFGLLGDVVLLSRESVYSASFMNLGVTPGVGATYVLPRKFGSCLGYEMMLSGRSYYGGELERRGVPVPVLPRAEVLEFAVSLAGDIASKPREALMLFKRHMVADVRQSVSDAVEAELAMHELTFHLPEVRERILRLAGR